MSHRLDVVKNNLPVAYGGHSVAKEIYLIRSRLSGARNLDKLISFAEPEIGDDGEASLMGL